MSDLLIDQDAVVRKEFRVLAKKLLRGAEPAAMAPHLRMFIAHICAGMSHVNEPIRAAALSLLDDMVPLFPQAAALFGHKLLPIFLHILGGGENSSSMTGGAAASSGAGAWAKMSGTLRGPKLKTMPTGERLAIIRSLHSLICAISGMCFAETHAAAVAARSAAAAAIHRASDGGDGGKDRKRRRGGEGAADRRGGTQGGISGVAGVAGVAGVVVGGWMRSIRGHQQKWQDTKRTSLALVRCAASAGRGGGGRGGVLAQGGGGSRGGKEAGGDAQEVEAVLGEFLLDTLPLLVQAWAEAQQCVTDASGEDDSAELMLLQLVELLHLSMAILFELATATTRPAAAAGPQEKKDLLSRQQRLVVGVCGAVMHNFPLETEQMRAASEAQVSRAFYSELKYGIALTKPHAGG